MIDRMSALMQNRSELLARIAGQREQLREIGTELQAPVALVDQGIAAVRYLRRHPLLVAGLVVFIVVRRRGVAGLAGGLWWVWNGYRKFTSISRRKLPQDA